MKLVLALFLGLVKTEDVDTGNYVPPYTEDDAFLDDEELGIDDHD